MGLKGLINWYLFVNLNQEYVFLPRAKTIGRGMGSNYAPLIRVNGNQLKVSTDEEEFHFFYVHLTSLIVSDHRLIQLFFQSSLQSTSTIIAYYFNHRYINQELNQECMLLFQVT